jgi:hypothetical protein
VKVWNIEPANVNMYDAQRKADFESSKRIAGEQLEISYMELYRYVPELQPKFDETINKIRTMEESSHDALESSLQKVLNDDIQGPKPGSPKTANRKQMDVGNDLRGEAKAEEARLHSEIETTTRQLRGQMLCLINLPDQTLRDPAERKVAVAKILSMTGMECPNTPK